MRYAVVGAGRRADEHVRVGDRLRNAGLVDEVAVRVIDAVDDRGIDDRGAGSTSFDDRGAGSISFDDLDAATVATAPTSRHAVATTLLEAGVDVLVEAPIAPAPGEARELVETADQCGRTLAAGYTSRHHAGLRALGRRIERGRLGEVEYVQTNRFSPRVPRTSAELRTWFGRDLDAYEYLLGDGPRRAVGCVEPAEDGGVDAATLVADYGGTAGVVNAAWTPPVEGECRHLIVGGSKRAAFLDYREGDRLELYDVDGGDDVGPLARDDADVHEVGGVDPLEAAVTDFLHAVETGGEPNVPGRVGVEVLETADGIAFDEEPNPDAQFLPVSADDDATDRSPS